MLRVPVHALSLATHTSKASAPRSRLALPEGGLWALEPTLPLRCVGGQKCEGMNAFQKAPTHDGGNWHVTTPTPWAPCGGKSGMCPPGSPGVSPAD